MLGLRGTSAVLGSVLLSPKAPGIQALPRPGKIPTLVFPSLSLYVGKSGETLLSRISPACDLSPFIIHCHFQKSLN